LLAASTRLLADGGMMLLHQKKSPYTITVFAAPTPTRVGGIDLSVLLQSSETLEPVLDADIEIEFVLNATRIAARGTRGQAQNKLLYAASFPVNEAGEWTYSVTLRKPGDAPNGFTISGALTIAPAPDRFSSYAGYLALPFLCLGIFAMHQWLARKRDAAAEVQTAAFPAGSPFRP
jgi:hypothetical protein